MVNAYELRVNSTVLTAGSTGLYSVNDNTTSLSLSFKSTNAACTNISTLIEERLTTF